MRGNSGLKNHPLLLSCGTWSHTLNSFTGDSANLQAWILIYPVPVGILSGSQLFDTFGSLEMD